MLQDFDNLKFPEYNIFFFNIYNPFFSPIQLVLTILADRTARMVQRLTVLGVH